MFDSIKPDFLLPLYLTEKKISIPETTYAAFLTFLTGYILKKIEEKFECITRLISTSFSDGSLLR